MKEHVGIRNPISRLVVELNKQGSFPHTGGNIDFEAKPGLL
jgi:hypothetical protein